MPSSRQFKVIGFVTLLAILVIYYITSGAQQTYDSEFYQRTVAAIDKSKDAAARKVVVEDERQRAERVERLRKEHDVATATATAEVKPPVAQPAKKQQPIVEEKNVAGRKKTGDKVVKEKPATDNDDGVAKVGNVGGKDAAAKAPTETDEEHQVETLLNEILRKGPIIVFSKSYCPYSKKAKVRIPLHHVSCIRRTNKQQHILLDLYDITPPPYVVELDHEELGPGLQSALLKSTGRRTVPNVLINGKSIGGGDDIQALHESGKLIDKVQAMGGKRVMSVVAKKAAIKFKA